MDIELESIHGTNIDTSGYDVAIYTTSTRKTASRVKDVVRRSTCVHQKESGTCHFVFINIINLKSAPSYMRGAIETILKRAYGPSTETNASPCYIVADWKGDLSSRLFEEESDICVTSGKGGGSKKTVVGCAMSSTPCAVDVCHKMLVQVVATRQD